MKLLYIFCKISGIQALYLTAVPYTSKSSSRSQEIVAPSIRFKSPLQLGVDNVQQYSGYVDFDNNSKHLFFWFFESRNDPENDPVILWLNGGPGCASTAGGLFYELGPSNLLQDEEGVIRPNNNPYSWNRNASVLFLDQPVNTGFSYASSSVNRTSDAADDFVQFLKIFFEAFPQYSHQGLHLAGESYAGHYLPSFAKKILDIQAEKEKLNFDLKSIVIGNGLTDVIEQTPSWKAMACGQGGYPSILNDTQCDELSQIIPICQVETQQCYDNSTNDQICANSGRICRRIFDFYYQTMRNPYDIREVCGNDGCPDGDQLVEDYFNDSKIKQAIGAEKSIYVACNSSVNHAFYNTGDRNKPCVHQVAYLLEHNIPIMIYAGDKDYRCNWLGNLAWTNSMRWSGQYEYNQAEMKPWYVEGKAAGQSKFGKKLKFVRVYDAGHMVPHYKPLESFQMINDWIDQHR